MATQQYGHAVLTSDSICRQISNFSHGILAIAGSYESYAAISNDHFNRGTDHVGVRDDAALWVTLFILLEFEMCRLRRLGLLGSSPMLAPCKVTMPKLFPSLRSMFSLKLSHGISGFESRPLPSAIDPVRRG